MSKPDLTSLYKLEFYKKQDNWRLASKPRRRGKEKCATSASGDFNKTYVLSKSAANITTKLNDAFLENDSAAEDNGQMEKSQNETQKMNSFNELWSNPEESMKEEQVKPMKPQNTGSPTPEIISKINSCISPSSELPNIFLPHVPLHTDLWSEKVDFDLIDCNNFVDPTPQLQSLENNAKTENEHILVNILKKHKFLISQLDCKVASAENDARKEDNENPPQNFEPKHLQQNKQEEFNKDDILTKLKRKILRANLFNNNYLIPNANHQPILDNNDFESYFHNTDIKTNANDRRSLSLHEGNFELTNQEQRNFERNFVESTLPTTLRSDLEMNVNAAHMIEKNSNEPNYKNNVKPFKNINNDFQYVPTDLTESSQNCYLNQNTLSPHNQYITNNFKPIFFNQKFKSYFGDSQAVTNQYEVQLKKCQILCKNYHPEEVTKNFQNDAKSFHIDASNYKMNPIFQNDSNNFQFDQQSGNIVDHNYNMLHQNPKHQNLTHQNSLVHQNLAHQNDLVHQYPSPHQDPTLPKHNQIPQNHQIFARNPQIYSQITCDPGIEAYPEVLEDHCDPYFEWTENFKEQVLDDIDGIWSEGREALSNANQWLNVVVDEENLSPNMDQVCTQMEDLNMNTTSSTDSATFMRGAALAPHSSEINLSTATGGREINKLASLVQRHATALKSLLSRADSDNSLCIQITSSTQQKRHSATNTTPDQSCDYYPTRDVGSNTPLIDPTSQTTSGDFDAKLDQLREKLAQDQERFENCAADQKLYTVFSKFQQYKEGPSLEVISKPEQQFPQNLVQQNMHHYSEFNKPKFEPTEKKLHQGELTCHTLQQVEHNFQSTDRKLQQVELNFQSTEHNQQIEHKSGHYNMRTVNKTEMGIYKQTSTNFGPYSRRRRPHSNNNFNYLCNIKVNQRNDCALGK